MRERIMQAYMELASSYGLDGMTMDQVAARAGVSKRTVYRYFPSKEALLLASVEALKQTISVKARQLAASGLPVEQIIAELLVTLSNKVYFLLNPRGMEDLRLRYPQVWQDIDRFRQERIQELYGQVLSDLEPEIPRPIIMTIILTTIREVLNPEFILSNNLTFEDTVHHVSRLLLRMMSNK